MKPPNRLASVTMIPKRMLKHRSRKRFYSFRHGSLHEADIDRQDSPAQAWAPIFRAGFAMLDSYAFDFVEPAHQTGNKRRYPDEPAKPQDTEDDQNTISPLWASRLKSHSKRLRDHCQQYGEHLKTSRLPRRCGQVRHDAVAHAAYQSVALRPPETHLAQGWKCDAYGKQALDVAVTGDAWMGFSAPGNGLHARRPDAGIHSTGELQTVAGFAVLDSGGTSITIDPKPGRDDLEQRDHSSQGINEVGQLGLFEIPTGARN